MLFLYLVVILHATNYPGIVYATGKYAPKLMKMLKEKVSEEDMGRLEAWKEGAKTGRVGAEGRAGIRGMAEGAIGGGSTEVDGRNGEVEGEVEK